MRSGGPEDGRGPGRRSASTSTPEQFATHPHFKWDPSRARMIMDDAPLFTVLAAFFRAFWLDMLLFVVAIGFGSADAEFDKPFNHFFVERDPTLSFPYEDKEHVPTWLLYIISIGLPLLVIFAYLALKAYHGEEPMYRQRFLASVSSDSRTLPHGLGRFVVLLAYLNAIAFTILLTASMKEYAGRLRPNFFALCDYRGYRKALESGNFDDYNAKTEAGRIGSFDACESSDSDIRRARFSFPSGHSSMSFCGLSFVAWLLYSLGHYRTPWVIGRPNIRRFIYTLASLACLMGATFVAVSRTIDYWHNYADVLAGSCLGLVCSFVSVKFYGLRFQAFPGLDHNVVDDEHPHFPLHPDPSI